jgi:hypothetical protein
LFRHRPFRRPSNTPFLDSFCSSTLPDFIDPSDYGVLSTCIAGSPSTDVVRESARFAFLAVKGTMSIWHLGQDGFIILHALRIRAEAVGALHEQ